MGDQCRGGVAVQTTDAVRAGSTAASPDASVHAADVSASDGVDVRNGAVRARSAATLTDAPVHAADVSASDGAHPRSGSGRNALVAGLQRGGARVAAAHASALVGETRDEWLGVVSECQALLNVVTALQEVALTEVARRERDWCEDGTLGETVHGHGRVTLDAADVAAPALGVSHSQAQRRVHQAVRLGAGRVPEEADSGVSPEPSGLGALHTAMANGRLDGYRAGVVAAELELAPADVAEAVVAALEPHLGDEGPLLRRRCRRLLARISPELLRRRAMRARAETGLRRWVAEPGVDVWHGTFPSEEAALAWAAIDRLAHDLVAAGTCSSVEQARGKALTDLVTGHATIDVQVVLTVPADACSDGAADPTLPATGVSTGSPTSSQTPAGTATTGTEGELEAPPPTTPYGDPAAVARTTGARAEPQSATPAQGDPAAVARTTGARGGAPGSHDGLVEVQGARPSEPLLVRRGWLLDRLGGRGSLGRRPDIGGRQDHPPTAEGAEAGVGAGAGPATPPGAGPAGTPGAGPVVRARTASGPGSGGDAVFAPCDPLTGARVDPGDRLATGAYRPGAELVALVRARDGRCRFPGCSVAARFCDLDHVRPWPIGPTAARNLLCLCRRHHRIKQRPGWRVRLAPDGTATWTDSAGRARTTEPLDALDSLVLLVDRHDDMAAHHGLASPSGVGAPDRMAPPPTPRTQGPPWSALETRHELWIEHRGSRDPLGQPGHRRCTSSAQLRAACGRRRPAPASFPDVPPF